MNPMRFAAVVAGLVVSLTLVSSGAGGTPEQITPVTVTALTSWVEAVKTHVPGRADAPVVSVAALSYEAREELNAGMEFFLNVLVGGIYDTRRNRAAKMVAELAQVAPNPDADSFLKQAAVLHADVAAYGERVPGRSTRVTEASRAQGDRLRIGGGMGSTTIQRDEAVPPLLIRNRLVLSQDGQIRRGSRCQLELAVRQEAARTGWRGQARRAPRG